MLVHEHRCSPGAWLQVACQEIGPRGGCVLGVDLQVNLQGGLVPACLHVCTWKAVMGVWVESYTYQALPACMQGVPIGLGGVAYRR
jgi:hypothetical protein